MRLCGILAVVVLAACGSSGTTAGTSPATSGSGSPTAGASASSSPSPSPVAALPCRMPVTLGTKNGTTSDLGWLSLPSGATTADPINHIIITGDFPTGGGSSQPIWATDHSPQLYGNALGTYSNAAGKWLPDPPELVAPDELHYAYLHPDGTIRLADSNGGEAIVPNPNKLTPLAYTSSGVVLTSSDIASNGLWLLDLVSHAITSITPPVGNDNWLEVSGVGPLKVLAGTWGIAWGLDSPGVLGYPAPTKVLSEFLGLQSTPTTAYTAPAGDSIVLIASDPAAGVLVVLTGTAPGLMYLKPGGGAISVQVPGGVSVATLGPRHHADAHGIWFIGYTGIFLFTTGSGLQKIAPAVTSDIVPGGDCV